MPKIPVKNPDVKRLSKSIISEQYRKIKEAQLYIKKEAVELTGSINNLVEALRIGGWNESGCNLQILASLAINPDCHLISLEDLYQILKQIESPEQARYFTAALIEILDTESISFLIRQLLHDDYQQFENNLHSFLRADMDNPLEALIISLIRKEIRFHPDIQIFLNNHFVPYLQRTMLVLLQEYLSVRHQSGIFPEQQTHALTPEALSLLTIIANDHAHSLVHLGNSVPAVIKENCTMIAEQLKAHSFSAEWVFLRT